MSRIRYYNSGGNRYYVIDVPGFTIDPRNADLRAAAGGAQFGATYAVLDRDDCHREMGIFAPSTGRHAKWCKKKAEALAAELNAADAA